MKQSLQLKMGQQLTMTPQLQQAIRLLQLSSLDLQAEIQEALDNNPLLEVENDADDAPQESSQQTKNDDSQKETSDALNEQSLPDDLPLDSTWDDTYTSTTPTSNCQGPDQPSTICPNPVISTGTVPARSTRAARRR